MNPTKKRSAVGHIALALACALALGACGTNPQETRSAAPPADASVHAGGGRLTSEEVRDYQGARATQLFGRNVQNTRGEHLGTIQDVVVHMSTGDVRYVVLYVHDAQAGDRLYAVPMRMLKIGEGQKLTMDVDRQRLVQQKWWLRDRWPGLQDSVFWGEIDRLSGLPAVQPAQAYYAYRLTQLIGKGVDSFDGRHLGTIRDVVLNLNTQKVHYAVLGFQPYIGLDTNRLFAVPLEVLVFRNGDPDRLALNMPRDRLARLGGFDPARWPHLNDPRTVGEIERYFMVIFPPQPAAAAGATR